MSVRVQDLSVQQLTDAIFPEYLEQHGPIVVVTFKEVDGRGDQYFAFFDITTKDSVTATFSVYPFLDRGGVLKWDVELLEF